MAGLYGFLAERHALRGVYRVTTFVRAASPDGAPDSGARWVRVAVAESGDAMLIQRADGAKERVVLTIDKGRGVWTFQAPGYGAVRLGYRVAGSGVITLDGTMGAAPVQVVLTPQGDSLLLGRGFHWINETPFNR